MALDRRSLLSRLLAALSAPFVALRAARAAPVAVGPGCTPRCGGPCSPYTIEEERRLREQGGDAWRVPHAMHSPDCPSRHAFDEETQALRKAAGLPPSYRKPRTEPHWTHLDGHRIAATTDTKDEDTTYLVWMPGREESTRIRLTKDDIAGMAYFAGIFPLRPT